MADTNGKPIVELCGLHKRFGELVVLDGLDMTLHEGETKVIIGESGSGKSVILKHVVRLLVPDRGEVHYRGKRIDDLHERELADIRPEFGFLFQLSALFDSMTVGENVAFPLVEHRRLKPKAARDIAEEKLTMVGLPDIQDKWPADLSGGQKKRVALARAIAVDPKVILYDEPTTGLDPPRSDVINELILKLQRELGVSSVVVTHDMASANKVADRITMLFGGKMIYEGTPEEVAACDDPRVRRFVSGQADEDELRSLQQGKKP